jgi:chromosome segregation ATPase
MTDDLQDEASEKTGKKTTDTSSSNSETSIDYKARFEGATRKIDKLVKQMDALQSRYDLAVEEHEGELADLRKNSKSESSRVKELEREAANAKADAEKLQAQLTGITEKETIRAKIKDKYPALESVFDQGDLKDKSLFKDETEYDAYLDRMAKIAGAQQSLNEEAPPPDETENQLKRVTGAVPANPLRAREGQKKARSVSEINEELWSIDSKDKKNQSRLVELYAELDASGASLTGVK